MDVIENLAVDSSVLRDSISRNKNNRNETNIRIYAVKVYKGIDKTLKFIRQGKINGTYHDDLISKIIKNLKMICEKYLIPSRFDGYGTILQNSIKHLCDDGLGKMQSI